MQPSEFDGGEPDVLISAIEHHSYCPRQCALIHIEQTFDENLFTIRGTLVHERVDAGSASLAAGVRVLRDVPLWSERLGLRGKSDVVEMHGDTPYPVEYKAGGRRGIHADLQLCAQALCLEEMLEIDVPAGAIFHHATRKRREVQFDARLRNQTIATVEAIRAMLASGKLPPAPNDARCPNCSLINACLPEVVGEQARLRGVYGATFRPLSLDANEDSLYDPREAWPTAVRDWD